MIGLVQVLSMVSMGVLASAQHLEYKHGIDGGEFITDLTNETFHSFIQENPNAIVEWYANWCGKCRLIAPELAAAAETAAELGWPIVIGRIDVDKYAELTEDEDIGYFPTLQVYTNGKRAEQVGNAPHQNALLTRMARVVGAEPPTDLAVKTDIDTVQKFTDWVFWRGNDASAMETTLVAFVPPDVNDHGLLNTVRELSEELLDWGIRTVIVRTNDIINTFKLPPAPRLVLYKDFDEGREQFDGLFTKEDVKKWVLARNTALVTTVTHYTLRRLQAADNILVHVFVPGDVWNSPPGRTETVSWFASAVSVAEHQNGWPRGTLTVAITDAEQYGPWMDQFNLPRAPLPAFGATHLPSGKKYAMALSEEDSMAAYTYEELEAPGNKTVIRAGMFPMADLWVPWLEQVVKGEATPVSEVPGGVESEL